jgi:hypothetical protein
MDKPWYEVGNWSLDANMSSKLDKALTEFTSRVDDELFQRLGQEIICIVDCAIGASTVRPVDITCAAHTKKKFRHQVYVMVFRREVEKLSDKATLGEVAHQFAHLTLRLEHKIDSETIPTGEEMADTLAISWGFKEEIEANLAEWEALEGATRGRAHKQK